MTSFFTWLDYSERDRRRALYVVDLFKTRETRDDLGIGTVRDALSDILFPGTTTIMTRARYFFFVPWMYKELERKRVSSEKIAKRARWGEIRLIDTLLKSDDTGGVIGKNSRERLQRLPSNIYWLGLQAWGICTYPGSQYQYQRWLDRHYRSQRRHWDSKEDREGHPPPRANWHPRLPEAPQDFPQIAELRLRKAEAIYLRDRIQERAPGTLLAFLVDRGKPMEEIAFVWEHALIPELPARIRFQLEHAQCFSEAIYGAAILYNIMLAEATKWSEGIERYREFFSEWSETIQRRGGALTRWNLDEFWSLVRNENRRIPISTQRFVESWIEKVRASSKPEKLAGDQNARRLIREREASLKRSRARLQNQRYLELWQGASGAFQQDFRWGVTQRILRDILQALHRGSKHADAA